MMLLLCLLGVTLAAQATASSPLNQSDTALLLELENRFATLQTKTKETMNILSRQLMLQQVFVEERIRSDGDSGIKQLRSADLAATSPYLTNTFTSQSVAAGHDHSSYDRTVGLGELVAVLNGVEFRTRHNDYKIRMPSTTTSTWNALEDIPFPPVPSSVLQKTTVQEQAAEMREYFRAFNEQSTASRDWVPYFKPVMCYLEGGWTTNTETFEEPFDSDRHFVDASSWHDLQEKIRYTSYTGIKNTDENYAYLPTTIVNVTEDGIPVFAQWNYRIACHPIKTQLDLSYFRLIDDIAVRMRMDKTMDDTSQTMAARFAITPTPGHSYSNATGHAEYEEKQYMYGKLDEIMAEIPGKDNYPGHLTGKDYGYTKYRMDTATDTAMNTAFYHRIHKTVNSDGAINMREEGFADRNLWIAETSSPQIVDMGVRDCHDDNNKEVCVRHGGRFTYAIPLEVIWLTPLSAWNPYNVTVRDWNDREVVTANGRNGGSKPETAFNGSSPDNYYLTPEEFFHGGEFNGNLTDTAKKSVGVLDQNGQVRHLSASGIRYFLPDISGITAKIRTRYPVMPVHQEGSAVWKNMAALQDITMDMKSNTEMFEQRPKIEVPYTGGRRPDVHYVTTPSRKGPDLNHDHDVYVTAEERLVLAKNGTIRVFTSETAGHQHELELTPDPVRSWALLMLSCDGRKVCFDWHGIRVFMKP